MAYTTDFAPGFPTLYEKSWLLQTQQKSARTRPYVRTYDVQGGSRRFGKTGKLEPTAITVRYGDTNPGEATVDYRTLKTNHFKVPIRLDRIDMVRMAETGDLRNPTIQNQQAAYGRSWDKALYDGITGVAWGGEHGDVSIPWDTAYEVPVGYVYSGSTVNSGLTFAKLMRVIELFGINNVSGQDIEDTSPIVGLVTQRQITDLMQETRLTSHDYQAVKPLAGYPNMFDVLGIRLVVLDSNIIRKDSGDIRECVFYATEHVAFGISDNFMTSVDKLIDGNMDTQLWASWSVGATRLNDEGVVKVFCDESP